MRLFTFLVLYIVCAYSADTFNAWFKDGNVSGNIKYYYIETNKKFITGEKTSAHSNAIGGKLKYSTANWSGWKLGLNLMVTQGFLLPKNVESSTIGQDNGFMGRDPTDGFVVLGESYINYEDELINLWYGRRVITAPMVGAKEVRMLPSAVQGGEGTFFIDKELRLSFTYLDRFKQRSSDSFTNIVKHALGEDTRAITGSDQEYALSLAFGYKEKKFSLNLYDMYAKNFLNTVYLDVAYTKELLTLSAQWVSQQSIGNADTNLAKVSSVTKGKKINSNAIGVRAEINYKQSSFDLVYRNIFRDTSSYDSIITPWDGTFLYAYSSTTNNLGQSLYGKGLTAGGAYVGGTQGLKIGYTQKYDVIGIKGFKTHLAYARYQNPLYREDQEDLKAIIAYNLDSFSIQLKGIWIDNDTFTFKDGTVNQLDYLTQYHVIANYKF